MNNLKLRLHIIYYVTKTQQDRFGNPVGIYRVISFTIGIIMYQKYNNQSLRSEFSIQTCAECQFKGIAFSCNFYNVAVSDCWVCENWKPCEMLEIKNKISKLEYKISSIEELGLFGPGQLEYFESQDKLEEYEFELAELKTKLDSIQ